MHRYFVTGTDTDVGKTRVAAALALALRNGGRAPTVVKLVQTGLRAGERGDSAVAGALSGAPYVEIVRLAKPADPWSAARAEGMTLRARDLVRAIDALAGPIVVEGTGGVMVPLGAREHLASVVASAKLETIVAIGLRLGCINHALLTLSLCRRLRIRTCAAVLVERWGPTEAAYRDDVARALQGKLPVLGILPFAPAEAESVRAGAKLFEPLVNRDE